MRHSGVLLVIGAGTLLACSSNEKVYLPPASAAWARSYADDGINNTSTFRPESINTKVATDGSVVAVVGDIVGITEGPLANTGLSSGLVALLDASTGAPVFEQIISAQPRQGYAMVTGLTTAVAPDGVIVSGYAFGAVTIGTDVTDGYNGAFIVKFDRAGNVVWTKFPGLGTIAQVRTDAVGNVYLEGSANNPLDLGAGAFPAETGYHVFIAKLDPAGAPLFVNAYTATVVPGSAYAVAARGLVLDASGNATWFGTLEGSLDLGSGPLSSPPSPTTHMPITFLAQTSATGDAISAVSLGSTPISDVAVDPSGAPVVVGTCDQKVNLGAGDQPCTFGNAFIAKLGDDGYFTEVATDPDTHFNGNMVDQTRAGMVSLVGVAVNAGGNAFATGGFAGELAIGDVSVPWTSGISADVAFNDWTGDALLMGFDSSGRAFLAEGLGDDRSQSGAALAVDATGRLVVAGWLGGSITFGPNVAVTAQKGSDLFIAALSP